MKTPGHSVALFLFFIFLIYLHISVRMVEESGNFLIGCLFTFVIYKVTNP